MQQSTILFHVKKGPADPFRGDWYLLECAVSDEATAIHLAAKLTLENLVQWGKDWEIEGYEWSVFKVLGMEETKVWEGYKFIQLGGIELKFGRMD